MAEFVTARAGGHRAGLADIDDHRLAPVEEAGCPGLLGGGKLQRAGRRHGAADDQAVVMAVDEADLARPEQALHQELGAQGRRVHRLGVARVDRLAGLDLHGRYLSGIGMASPRAPERVRAALGNALGVGRSGRQKVLAGGREHVDQAAAGPSLGGMARIGRHDDGVACPDRVDRAGDRVGEGA